MSAERLLTVPDVAEQLHVGRSTVYRWVATGQLASVRLSGRTLRFRQDDIERFIRARRSRARKEQG